MTDEMKIEISGENSRLCQTASLVCDSSSITTRAIERRESSGAVKKIFVFSHLISRKKERLQRTFKNKLMRGTVVNGMLLASAVNEMPKSHGGGKTPKSTKGL